MIKKLGPDGLGKVWEKVYTLMKVITGEVDVENEGNLQAQIHKKIDKADVIQNATTRDTEKIPSAAVVADLQDQITAQNTKMTWTQLYNGKPAAVSLSGLDFRELMVELYITSRKTSHVTRILREQLFDVEKHFMGGHYYSTTDCSSFNFVCTGTQLYNIIITYGGNTIAASDIDLVVWYR